MFCVDFVQKLKKVSNQIPETEEVVAAKKKKEEAKANAKANGSSGSKGKKKWKNRGVKDTY